MVRRPRAYGLWLTLAALALLLTALAALQYRWIGEMGRAEAERRQAQLERSARRFAAGLDRELGQLMVAVHADPGPQAVRQATLLQRLAALPRSDQAALVSKVLVLSRQPAGDVTLESCAVDGSGCQAAAWTPPLEPLRRRLLDLTAERGTPDAPRFRPGELIDAPLALLVPMVDLSGEPPAPQPWARFRLAGLVVIELDAGAFRERVFPQLAEAQFGPLRASEFVVALVRRSDRSLLYSSDRIVHADELQHGDVELPVPGGYRRSADQPPGPESGFPRRLFGRPDREPRRAPGSDDPWLLVVRHRGGSLEHAVAMVRRRNLAIGLGVLALLGAAGAVLATGAQRARGLARQQLEFVASVTHELNTPLAAIRSAGQNLADGIVTDPAHVRRYGALIEQEGGRLSALVVQVLDFAGIESGSRVYAADPVSLGRIVDEVVEELRLVLDQSGLAVTKSVAADLPDVRGDAAALRRVVANLLTNAAKFAASGGCVTLRAARTPDGRAVVLRVEDAGPGIAPAERERVFEPFYRGAAAQRNDTPGSGLGLSLVRRVAQAHGGRVHIEQAAGGGTAVVLQLPASAPTTEPAA